ncbi:MAG: twin arginine-targeting protein translocase TatC [Omnitrophica WOR_2 bacterium RIFCSPHIGHO2_01_FULL_52_10]|nr:MAG: twin arginine-targeting protein translocase TatC [Omnitrophica WOR_2 bacterium RIFCSPHIGHO2_01_FULL_52_10]
MSASPDELSFWGHLDELRSRLLKSFIAVVVAACFFYPFVDRFLAFLIRPVGKVVFTSPADAFVVRLMLLICGGVVLALPVIVYQLWQFVAAGLKENEKKYVRFFAPASFVLFVAGCIFGYWVIIPVGMKFLLSFATESIVPMITLPNYISFIVTLVLAFGLCFQLPLVLMFLARIGIVTPAFLVQKRKHAIVLILIASAILTPSPDAISQILMAGPLLVLYELGVFASKFIKP